MKEEMLSIKNMDIFSYPSSVCPSTLLHINTKQVTSFGSGQCFNFDGSFGDPLVLIPEGGVCRVESIRRRQRCVSCGNISWVDDTIVCSGCQSQVFEEI